jgi:uncharacterized YkwD family protein
MEETAMKKKFFLLLFAILLVVGALFQSSVLPKTLAFATTLPTKATFFKAIVNSKNLNVRQGPSLNSTIISVLRNGDNVEVYGNIGDWSLIYHPAKKVAGLVYSQLIKAVSPDVHSTNTTAPNNPIQMTNPKIVTIPVPRSGDGKVIVQVPGNIGQKPGIVTPPTNVPAPKAPGSGGTAAKPSPVPPASGNGTTWSAKASAEENELLGYVNQARKASGVAALSFDDGVMKTARLKARDMVEKNYFSHQSPSYGSPFDMMRQYGITFKSAGENIAGNSSVRRAFDAWMKSAGHKKNILNANFNYCGFGIEPSTVYGKILVQQFIGR